VSERTAIRVEINEDGTKCQISYDGYVGNACLAEAEKLRLAFADLGLEIDTKHVQPTKEDVEVRKLPNAASVGAGG
jgi:hypothetical protein